MKVSVISAHDIDAEMVVRWRQLQATNPSLANPYFCVEYIKAAAAVCEGVFVGVMQEAGEIVGFFPFQQKRKGIAGPVGSIFSDYQGVIAAPDTDFDVEELLSQCGLKIWDFDHLLCDQKPFESWHQLVSPSPVIDISQGYEAYVAARRASGSRQIKQLERKWRGFERDIGTLRFELYSDSSMAFEQVITWKREQCLRTGVVDFMSWGWTTDLLREIWQKKEGEFSGMLSVLYCGDEIVAAHMGMRSAKVAHWWFPVYNHDYNKYSPGSLLLMKYVNELADQGLQLIDLGKGEGRYKNSFATGEIEIAEGSVMLPSMAASFRKAQVLGKAHLLQPAKRQLRSIRDLVVSARN